MCIDDASSRFSSLGGFSRVVSLSLSVSVLFSLTNELFFCPSFRVFDVFYYLGFQNF